MSELNSRITSRKTLEAFIKRCYLEFPEEVARLFEDYTRVIWSYKCVGEIARFYCDETVCYGEGGRKSVGLNPVIYGTLSFMRSFPGRQSDFVDIFAEGDEESGYSFGQATRFNAQNTGRSSYGPPTYKTLERDGEYCHSICECRVEKREGRWRITEEWVIESSEAIQETLTLDETEVEENYVNAI